MKRIASRKPPARRKPQDAPRRIRRVSKAPPQAQADGAGAEPVDFFSPEVAQKIDAALKTFVTSAIPETPKALSDREAELSTPIRKGGRHVGMVSRIGYLLSHYTLEDAWERTVKINDENFPPLDDSEIKSIFKYIVKKEKEKTGEVMQDGHPNIIPTCIDSERLREISWLNIQRIVEREKVPGLFRRGNLIVNVGVDPDDLKKASAERKPSIATVDVTIMHEYVTRSANWLRKTKDGNPARRDPPASLVKGMLAWRPLPGWIPELDSIVTSPAYGPDLELLRPGYNAVTRTLFAPSIDVEPPVNPTKADLKAALGKLDYLLAEFPWRAPSDRANYLGFLLTAVLRPAIEGNVPLTLITAPMPNAGKGTLCAIREIIELGTLAGAAFYSPNAEEARKSLFARLLTGQSITRIDNVRDGERFDSATLAAAITEGLVSDRVLGVSKTKEVRVKTSFVVTGNALSLGRDLVRRTMHVRLLPKNPDMSTKRYVIADLEGHVREKRAEYLGALLTMVEYWKAKGAPRADLTWNSFNAYVTIIGGVLAACGVKGFLENAKEMRDEGDPEGEEWSRLLETWLARLDADPEGCAWRTASWLLPNVFNVVNATSVVLKGNDDHRRARSLAAALRREVDRPRRLSDGRIAHVARFKKNIGGKKGEVRFGVKVEEVA